MNPKLKTLTMEQLQELAERWQFAVKLAADKHKMGNSLCYMRYNWQTNKCEGITGYCDAGILCEAYRVMTGQGRWQIHEPGNAIAEFVLPGGEQWSAYALSAPPLEINEYFGLETRHGLPVMPTERFDSFRGVSYSVAMTEAADYHEDFRILQECADYFAQLAQSYGHDA